MTKLDEVLALISEAEDRMKRARELVQQEAGLPSRNVWAGGLILAEVYREGGSVTRSRLHEIAQEYGMDNRGLGGFFTGRGSLQAIDELDRVRLTDEGVRTARAYLKKSGHPEAEPNFARVSESSLSDEWNSAEDAVYDAPQPRMEVASEKTLVNDAPKPRERITDAGLRAAGVSSVKLPGGKTLTYPTCTDIARELRLPGWELSKRPINEAIKAGRRQCPIKGPACKKWPAPHGHGDLPQRVIVRNIDKLAGVTCVADGETRALVDVINEIRGLSAPRGA
jgi:hypothetical protein